MMIEFSGDNIHTFFHYLHFREFNRSSTFLVFYFLSEHLSNRLKNKLFEFFFGSLSIWVIDAKAIEVGHLQNH